MLLHSHITRMCVHASHFSISISFSIVIYVNFSQAIYSGEEAPYSIIITIEADGFSIWPFSVVVTPLEVGGTSTCKLT